jgi:hypothetical protein
MKLLNPGIKAQELNKLLKAINIGDKSVDINKSKEGEIDAKDEDFNKFIEKK